MSSEIICRECNFSYNIDNELLNCDWCEHTRSEQNCCPNCSGIIEEFEQTICFWCFYSGIKIENEILYCRTCNCFCLNNDIFKDNKHFEHAIDAEHLLAFQCVEIRDVFPLVNTIR